MKFILSDGQSTNSKGYRIVLSGMRLERFAKNPVMLKEHDPEKVIGRWENFVIEDDKLSAEPVFDLDDPIGKEVARKVENNFLRASSIGIIPLSLEFINDEFVMSECELVEASIVSIPADSGAVRLYNDNLEELTFEDVKLNFNFSNNKPKIQKQMTEVTFRLSQKTIESLNLDADYTAKDVELAVLEKDKEIATLKAEKSTMEQTQQTEFLNHAVKAGKITEEERLSYVKLCEKGCFDEVKAIVESKPETASETLADKVVKSTATAGREDWDYLKWMKEDPKGLAKIKAENPKEFERLQETIRN